VPLYLYVNDLSAYSINALQKYASAYVHKSQLHIFDHMVKCSYMAQNKEQFVIIRVRERTRQKLKVKAVKARKKLYEIVDDLIERV
jgi:hypothetical protein